MRRLITPRCALEPLVRAHAPELFEVLSDPALYEFEGEPPASPEALAVRCAKLESRASPDGSERWLNWAIRLQDGTLAGLVQATVRPGGDALVAYQLASRHWRRGLGAEAVRAMLDDLAGDGVHTFVAVYQARNHRSEALLRRLGFEAADPAREAAFRDTPDERVRVRTATPPSAGPVRVAVLSLADAPAYRALMLEAYEQAADAFTSTPEERAAEPLSWWERRIADPEGLTRCFGAFDGQRLVGTVALEFSRKPKTRHAALVIGMYLQPAARGRGGGALLMRAALDDARARPGLRQLRLTVTEGNRPALRLYESVGFRAWGTEPMAILTPDGYKGKVHMVCPLGAAGAPDEP